MATISEVHRTFPFQPERVFDYVSDMLNYIEWFPGVLKLSAANNLPLNVKGKRYVEQLSLPHGPVELTLEVVECDAPRRFITEGDLPGLLPRMTIEISPEAGGGCRMSLKYETRDLELSADPVALKQIGAAITPRATAGLKRLHEILE